MKLYIIGGRPCSGKTTFAHRLGELTKYKVHYLDVFAWEQVEQSTSDQKQCYKWKTNEMVVILQENPEQLCEDYIAFYDEIFPALIPFLKNSNDEVLILESAMLLPKYIKQLQTQFACEVVYLKTSDEFVRDVYPLRDYAKGMITTKKGEIALENLLQRDSLFASKLYEEAAKLDYTIIDCSQKGFTESFEIISKHFKLDVL